MLPLAFLLSSPLARPIKAGGTPALSADLFPSVHNNLYSPLLYSPMSVRELEVLMALCKAAPLVQATKDAEALLRQLGPYLSEAHRQVFAATPLHQQMPPWELLAFDLTTAVLALGLQMSHHVVCGSSARCVGMLLAFKKVGVSRPS